MIPVKYSYLLLYNAFVYKWAYLWFNIDKEAQEK